MPPPRNNKLIRSLLQNSRPPIFFYGFAPVRKEATRCRETEDAHKTLRKQMPYILWNNTRSRNLACYFTWSISIWCQTSLHLVTIYLRNTFII